MIVKLLFWSGTSGSPQPLKTAVARSQSNLEIGRFSCCTGLVFTLMRIRKLAHKRTDVFSSFFLFTCGLFRNLYRDEQEIFVA